MSAVIAVFRTRHFVALAFALVLAGAASGSASAQTGPAVMFVPANFAPDLAMTGPASAGQPVQLAAQTGSPAQLWEFTDPEFEQFPTQIVNQQTGLCLDAAGTTAGRRSSPPPAAAR
jgi:hypothetical protein